MQKTAFYISFLTIFLVDPLSLKSQIASSTPSQFPNIIYILADDLGYGDVSCYNEDSKLQTVNIDQLANGGVMFTDAHTSSAVCTPTRYGILTGRYNWRSRLKSSVLSGYSNALIEPGRMTVAEMLQEKGYHTAFIGKWHLGWDWAFAGNKKNIDDLNSTPHVDFNQPIKNGPFEKGFVYSYGFSGSLDMPPYVYVENGRPTTIPRVTTVSVDDKGFWRKGLTGSDFRHVDVLPHLTTKAIQYIETQAANSRPFFLYFALPAPHTPILPTTEFMGKSNTNFYGDFVLQVDNVVGQIVTALEKSGIRGKTMLIFTSDNGCSPRANLTELALAGHQPSYIYRGHKADIYEGGHRVPFIVSWPNRILKASQTNEVICTTDFMATAAEITGFTLPENAGEDSYSFLQVIKQEKYNGPIREATVHHSIEGRFAIRQGKWKLILWPGSGGWSFPRTQEELQGLPTMQLFDLENDPAEKVNIIQKHPEMAKELKGLLKKYVENGRSTPGTPQKNDGPDSWAQLDWMVDALK
jgi:arylsulfatase A